MDLMRKWKFVIICFMSRVDVPGGGLVKNCDTAVGAAASAQPPHGHYPEADRGPLRGDPEPQDRAGWIARRSAPNLRSLTAKLHRAALICSMQIHHWLDLDQPSDRSN